MKKAVWVLIGVFSLFLMGCDFLTVATVDENGETVEYTYISLVDNTVYDSTARLKNWRDVWRRNAAINGNNPSIDDSWDDTLLFTIVNEKENIVVFGDANGAVEMSFFNGGCKCAVYVSTDSLNDGLIKSF
jgi:hypothetical protein